MAFTSLFNKKFDKKKVADSGAIVPAARGASEPRTGVVSAAAAAYTPLSEKEKKKQLKEKTKQEKADKKRLKQILKPHKGSILHGLQDAVSRSSIPDLEIILNNAKIETLDVDAWESTFRNASANPNKQVSDLLLNKLPAKLAFGDEVLLQVLDLALSQELWIHANLVLHRFNHDLLLRRLRQALQDSRQNEIEIILREFPTTISLLDPETERKLVPEQLSRLALTAILLSSHGNNFSAALVDACRRGSTKDVALLIRNPSMSSPTSDNWIRAIETTCNHAKLETLNLLLDRSPSDGHVRQSMLAQLRRAVSYDAQKVGRSLLNNYIKKYSVMGIWNDMGFADENYLRFYLRQRPTYAREVAEASGQTVLHFILSQWPKRAVMELVKTDQVADLEDPFKLPSGKATSKGTEKEMPGVSGDTPLIRAARMGLSEIAFQLIDWGADLDATDNQGQTVLHIATAKRDISLVDAICRNNPRGINDSDSLGRTALHIAVENSDAGMMHILLSRGIGTKALTVEGETACDIAIKKYSQAIVNIIRDHEALPPASVYDLRNKAGVVTTESSKTNLDTPVRKAPSTKAPSSVYHSTPYYPPVTHRDNRRREEYTLYPSDPAYWN